MERCSSVAQPESPIVYELDAADLIVSVNEAWENFARNNDGGSLTREAVLNKPLWSFIVHLETSQLYRAILQRVRTGRTIQFAYRCDAPQIRRFMSMEVSLLKSIFVQFESRIIRVESREPVRLLDATVERTATLLTVCGWCKKVRRTNGAWAEVEEVIVEMDLFNKEQMPQLTHGMCEDCYTMIIKAIE